VWAGAPPGVYHGEAFMSEAVKRAAIVEDCVAEADFIQENAPEREAMKQDLLAQIDAAAKPGAIVASSTSGLLPTVLARKMRRPERLVVGHPFNPAYLLPLVEIVGGRQTSPASIEAAKAFYKSLGMRPLPLREEIEGFVADPLMGTFRTFHLAGGEGGMRHMLRQFGPALKLLWTKLVAPELTDELIDKVADGCEDQAAGRSIKALKARRDDFLVDLLALVQKYRPEAEGRAGRL
jgi:carnitine 3-dehydrogenase